MVADLTPGSGIVLRYDADESGRDWHGELGIYIRAAFTAERVAEG